jgi:kinesin family protein 5
MTSAIQVFCRLRPCKQLDQMQVLSTPSTTTLALPDKTVYAFDHVFPPQATQQDVYEKAARPLLADLLKGYNITLFTYGQTSSGKTHTLYNQGLIHKTCEDIFQSIPAGTRVAFSCLEIYMETIYDLLEDAKTDTAKVIRELPDKTVYIENRKEVFVSDMKDLTKWIQYANLNKTIAQTLMNDRSSRAHCLFQMQIDQPNGAHSVLSIIDLAGSEKVKKSGATGEVLRQAQYINKSLFTLSNVIHLLSESKTRDKHIPYRDSKLTRVLQHSLGGSAKTAVIICVIPSEDAIDETISTLRFGTRCKFVLNKPVVNTVQQTMDMLRQKLAEAEKEIERLLVLHKRGGGGGSSGPCKRCEILEQELEEYKMREEVAKTTANESGAVAWEKYVIPVAANVQTLSNAELRQLIAQHDVSQRFFLIRQKLLLNLLASRNALIASMEKKMYAIS